MAFTQSDVDAIKTAMTTGVSQVHFADGRRVYYRTMDELKLALALAQAEVAGQAGADTVSYASFSKD